MKVAIVRDPLYGYIELSPIEEAILSRPVVQRLHRITQNGLACLTYPSNRTSRFAHSLGAMHIAGAMLKNAILDSHDGPTAPSSVITSFTKQLERECENRNLGAWQHKDLTKQASRGYWSRLGFSNHVHVVAWQGIRLACLLHDLGHLPFSHTPEVVLKALMRDVPEIVQRLDALRKALRQKYKLHEERALHEMIGVWLSLDVLEPDAADLRDSSINKLLEQSLKLAQLILLEDSGKKSALGALHTLIDGEVDADRADYVLRDALTSGVMEIGNYDLDRIIHCTQLRKDQGCFRFQASERALHAIEGFCLARFRMWRALVFQTNVVRSELALSRLLYLAGKLGNDVNGVPRRVIEAIHSSGIAKLWEVFDKDSNRPLRSGQFVGLDEPLLFTAMRSLLSGIDTTDIHSSSGLREFYVYLRFVLDRDKSRMVALWKRIEDYRDFAKYYVGAITGFRKTKDPVRRMNEHLKARLGQSVGKHGDPIGAARGIEKRVMKKLGNDHSVIRLAFHMDLDPSLGGYRVATENGSVSLQDLSPIFQSTLTAWESDVHFHAFNVLLDGDLQEESHARKIKPKELAPVLAECVEAWK